MGAVKYLEGLQPESVKNAADDFFFHWAAMGEGKRRIKEAFDARGNFSFRELKRVFWQKKIQQQVRRNLLRYVQLVKKVLVPGGSFILVAIAVQKSL
jgi:transcription initiation factor TFIIIB Brf1 subunit/transcription initiation factor TFIIB